MCFKKFFAVRKPWLSASLLQLLFCLFGRILSRLRHIWRTASGGLRLEICVQFAHCHLVNDSLQLVHQVEGQTSTDLQAIEPARDVDALEAGESCEHVGNSLVPACLLVSPRCHLLGSRHACEVGHGCSLNVMQQLCSLRFSWFLSL